MAEYAATIKYRVRRMEEYLKASTEILGEIIKGKDMPKPSDYIASHPTVIAKAKASKLTAKKLAAWVAYLDKASGNATDPVSYIHLTLPTIYSV